MACFAVMAMLGGIVNARERSGSAVLPSGPVVVAIAPATALSRDLQSDAYGDYAEYLNSFAANRPAGLKVVRLSLASYRELYRQPKIAASYATIFLRRTGQAMIYQGMILEPQVYEAGARWAAGGKAPAVEIGLRRTRLIRRC